jgi:signal transduction histidine kinase/ligand-binding sensor domain-containing protein
MILLFMLTFSCDRKQASVAFPLNETEFSIPESQPLSFSEPKKIEWLVNDSTTFSPPLVKKVDLENVPAKPFYPDGFFPLKRPMEVASLDFNILPDTLFNGKDLPASPIDFTTAIIEPPLRVQAGLPKIKKNATVGIFEFGEDQGFPGYLVSAMMEDSHGMMWIATDRGLCRFNGEYLEIYNFIDPVFTGGQATVSNMVEDEKGRIWVYTNEKGIYVLDLKAGVVNNFIISNQTFADNSGSSMVMDSRGLIWLGSLLDGLYIVDPMNDNIRHIPHLRSQDNGNVGNIVEDRSGKMWISSSGSLAIIDFDKGRIRFFNEWNGHSITSVTGLFRDGENKIWVGTEENGVFILDEIQGTVQHLGSDQGFDIAVHYFTEDKDKNLWMSTEGGIYIFNPSKQTLKFLNETKGLSDDLVNTIYLDRQGQIWIATGTALNLMDTEGLMPNFLTAANGLSGPDVWSFFEDQQHHLWIGSRQGLDIYDPEKNQIKGVENALQLTKSGGISYKIQQMPEGEYLIVAPRFGLALFNPKKQTITTITTAQGLNNPFPASSLVDRSGRIWTGSFQNGGVEFIDLENNTFKVLTNNNGLVGNIVWELWEDDLGQIWVATDAGINIINVENNTISQLMEGGKISTRNGGAFLQDAQRRLWIGSRSGILIADQEKGILTTISAENGLIEPAVYTLYEYNGDIYAGTGNGLTVFSPRPDENTSNQFSYKVKSFGKAQGLVYTDFNAGSALAYKNKLWFGIETQAMTITNIPKQDTTSRMPYISGITIADQNKNFNDNNTILHRYPKLDTLFSSQKDTFYLSGKFPKKSGWLQENNIQWDSLNGYFNLPANLKIPFEQNFISFQFTGAQLTNRDKVRYRYSLDGFDTQWSEITDKPFSKNYRNLPAGQYTFKISSRTYDGIWSRPAAFSFTILPHWTNTWWAWVLYIMAFLIVVGAIVQYRARMLKKENFILEEKVKHRTAQLNKSVEDLRATQTQLIQSEKMASLGELTAGIAHEIQNPLNFVNNFSDVSRELIEELKEERAKSKEERDAALEDELLTDINQKLEKISHHGKRADSIVKGMLQHSRASSGEKEPTDINVLADEYLRLAYHGLRAKDKSFNATLETDFDKKIGKISIIPQDMGRVVLNLITNAFHAVQERKKQGEKGYEPTVGVATKTVGDSIQIAVKDNGNGIPDAVKEKIFQPFFTTKPTGQGTGLGLSMSYDIVTRGHQGELKVLTKEGEGTTFLIVLPLKQKPNKTSKEAN